MTRIINWKHLVKLLKMRELQRRLNWLVFVCTGLKYQHWGKVLNAVRSLKLSVLSSPLPERGVLLGGSLALHGKAVSLACFHGVNFRSQSWVLFTLQRPYMTFTSKVCTVEKSCQVRRVKAVQDLSLRLGYGPEDSVSGKLSPSSGKGIETPGGDLYKNDGESVVPF